MGAKRLRLSDLTSSQQKAMRKLADEWPTYTHHIDDRTGNALHKRKLVVIKMLAANTVRAYKLNARGRIVARGGSVSTP